MRPKEKRRMAKELLYPGLYHATYTLDMEGMVAAEDHLVRIIGWDGCS